MVFTVDSVDPKTVTLDPEVTANPPTSPAPAAPAAAPTIAETSPDTTLPDWPSVGLAGAQKAIDSGELKVLPTLQRHAQLGQPFSTMDDDSRAFWAEAYRHEQSKPLTVGGTAAAMVKAIPGVAESAVKGAAHLGKDVLLNNPIVMAGRALAGQDVTPALREQGAAIEAGTQNMPAMVRSGYHNLMGMDGLSNDEVQSRINDELAWQEQHAKVLKGQGTTADIIPGADVNPEDTANASILTDPINFIPAAGAAKVLGAAGDALGIASMAEIPLMSKAAGIVGKAGDLIPTAVGTGVKKLVQAPISAIQKPAEIIAEKTPAEAGLLGLAGEVLSHGASPIVGAVMGSLAPPIAKRVAAIAEKVGSVLPAAAGDAAEGLTRNVVLPAVAHGATAAVIGAPLALTQPDDESAGQVLAGAAVFGAAHGALSGAAHGVAGSGSEFLQTTKNRPVVPFTPYADEAPVAGGPITADNLKQWDAQTQQWVNRNASTKPVDTNLVSWVRSLFGNVGGQETRVFSVTPETFQNVTGQDSNGAFYKTVYQRADGSRVNVILLNQKANAMAALHESGHLIQEGLMSPDQQADWYNTIRKTFSPEDLAAWKAYYEHLLNADRPAGSEPATITDEQAIQEVGAESLSNILRGYDGRGLPVGWKAKAMQVVGGLLEAVGLHDPRLGGSPEGVNERSPVTPAPGGVSPLGVSPSFDLFKAGRDWLARNNIKLPDEHLGEQSPEDVARVNTPAKPAKIPAKIVLPKGAGAAERNKARRDLAAQPPILDVGSGDDYSKWTEGENVLVEAGVGGNVLQNFRDLRDAQGKPVTMTYHAVDRKGDATRSTRRAEQAEAYTAEQTGVPPETLRSPEYAQFVPNRVILRNDIDPETGKPRLNVNLLGTNPAKVVQNAALLAQTLREAKIPVSSVIPFELGGNERLTPTGTKQLLDTLEAYSQNHAHGYRGDGSMLARPEGYEPHVPPHDPTFTPHVIDQHTADLMNLLMGQEPPKTARTGGKRFAPERVPITTPANVSGVQLAKANAPERVSPAVFSSNDVVASKRSPNAGKPKNQFPDEFGGEPVQETNPLRAAIADKGVDLSKILKEAVEERSLEHISDVKPVGESGMKPVSSPLVDAGFMPSNKMDRQFAKNKKELYSDSGFWMSPDGDMQSTGHHEVAARKISGLPENSPDPYEEFPGTQALVAKGWKPLVHDEELHTLFVRGPGLTRMQKSALERLGIEEELPVMQETAPGKLTEIYRPPGSAVEPTKAYFTKADTLYGFGSKDIFTKDGHSFMPSTEAAQEIADRHNATGGSTYLLSSGRFAGKDDGRYGVSIYPERSEIVDGPKVSMKQVENFIETNSDLLENEGNVVGTWYDKASDKTYLDVTVGTNNRELAEHLGKKYNQKAVWDNGTQSEIPTGGTGEAKNFETPESDRLREAEQTTGQPAFMPSPATWQSSVSNAGKALDKRGLKLSYGVSENKSHIGTQYHNLEIRDKRGELIGELDFDTTPGEQAAFLNNVRVDEKSQSRGLGTAMYAEMAARLKMMGIKYVEGDIISHIPLSIRDKLFGAPIEFSDRGTKISANEAMYRLPDSADDIDTPRGIRVRHNIPDSSSFMPTPNPEVRKSAEDYMKGRGPYVPHQEYRPVNEPVARKVADWYEGAQHDVKDSAASYEAMKRETRDQWNHIVASGVKLEPWTGEGEPYKNSAEMAADVRDNKHLWFFRTEGGFGEGGDSTGHPLLEDSGVKAADGTPLLYNDLFRAVHDYYGHAKEGFEFGPKGEYNAFLAHSKMYSDKAKPAMASETMGQNSWVNYGPHLRDEAGKIAQRGEQGFVPLKERKFADQKAVAMPDDLLKESLGTQKKEVTVTGPEGTRHKAIEDGEQPGFGTQSPVKQYTLPDGIPDHFPPNATTYGPTLEKLGFKVGNESPVFMPSVKADDLEYGSYWMDREGNFLQMKNQDHQALAEEKGVTNDDIYKQGYVRVMSGIGGERGIVEMNTSGLPGDKGTLTPKQRQAVDTLQERGIPVYLNSKNTGQPSFMPSVQDDKGPVWYSRLQRAVEEKMPDKLDLTPERTVKGRTIPGRDIKDAAGNVIKTLPERTEADKSYPAQKGGEQLGRMLEQAGVSPDEMKWTGLDDYLSGKDSVTKDEVLKFLDANKVDVKEVTGGGTPTLNVADREMMNAGASRLIEAHWYEPAEMQEGLSEAGAKKLATAFDVLRTASKDGDVTKARQAADKIGEIYDNAGMDTEQADELSRELTRLEEKLDAPDTKFKQYQLPGGENYREVLFTLPEDRVTYNESNVTPIKGGMEAPDPESFWYFKTPDNVYQIPKSKYPSEYNARQYVIREKKATPATAPFKSNHWDEPNVLAHTRVNDRIDSDGRPGLFSEEFQSDWHQKGRKEGYKTETRPRKDIQADMDAVLTELRSRGTEYALSEKDWTDNPDLNAKYDALMAESDAAKTAESRTGVPDAPFKSSWHELVFKRLVRMVAEQGKDWLGWTTGDQQAERYDLSKQVSEIHYDPETRNLFAYDNARVPSRVLDETVDEDKLPDYIGKDAATRLLKSPRIRPDPESSSTHSIRGDDLKIGGEGMKGFYDKILVDYGNKFGKKWGAKVHDIEIPKYGLESTEPGQKVSQNKAVTLFFEGGKVFGETLDGTLVPLTKAVDISSEKYKNFYAGDAIPTTTVHALDITSEMRKSVMTEGNPMFQPTLDQLEAKWKKPTASGYYDKSQGLTGWIQPTGAFTGKQASANTGDIHYGILNANPKWAKTYKFDPEGDAREEALRAGFARTREEGGRIHVEALASKWGKKQSDTITEMLAADDFVSGADVSLLNDKMKVVREKTIENPSANFMPATELYGKAKAFDDLVKDHAADNSWVSGQNLDDLHLPDPGTRNLGTVGIKGSIARKTALAIARRNAAKDAGLDPSQIGSVLYRAQHISQLQDFIQSLNAPFMPTAVGESSPVEFSPGDLAPAVRGTAVSDVDIKPRQRDIK